MNFSEKRDLENPLIEDESKEQDDFLNTFKGQGNTLSAHNLSNLPISLQQKYGNSFKIKWVFNQMLKMSFSEETLILIFNRSISIDDRDHSKEEILNLAIDTYLAREFTDSFENEEVNESINQFLIKTVEINKPIKIPESNIPTFFQKIQNSNISNKTIKRCKICYLDYSMEEFCKIARCNHEFCNKCILEHLNENIINGKIAKIICPYENCKNDFLEEEIKEFLNDDQETLQKYFKFKKNLEISLDPKYRWCIKPGCGFLVEGNSKDPKTICKCGQIMCFNCMYPWHEGKDCESAIDKEFKKYIEKGKVKNCPKCKCRIEKNEGCNHIYCTRCRYNFCWLCNKEYKQGHYEWYNLLGCPMMMYTRVNESKFHSYILCLKKSALIFGLTLAVILLASLIIALIPLALALIALFFPVILYVKIFHPQKNFKGISIGIVIFILGLPLTPFILLMMIVPGSCIMLFCRNRFDQIYL